MTCRFFGRHQWNCISGVLYQAPPSFMFLCSPKFPVNKDMCPIIEQIGLLFNVFCRCLCLMLLVLKTSYCVNKITDYQLRKRDRRNEAHDQAGVCCVSSKVFFMDAVFFFSFFFFKEARINIQFHKIHTILYVFPMMLQKKQWVFSGCFHISRCNQVRMLIIYLIFR